MPTSIILPDSLADRIGTVASHSHRTPLCIITLCVNAHLPALEEAAKHLAVFHPSELAKTEVPSASREITADLIWSTVADVTQCKKGNYLVAVLAAGKLFPGHTARMSLKFLKIPSQSHKRIVEATADWHNLNQDYVAQANEVVKRIK